MDTISLAPDLLQALQGVLWKSARYPSSLPPLSVADLHTWHAFPDGSEWVGVGKQDWAVTRIIDPAHGQCAAPNSGELHAGFDVEFTCRKQASMVVCPLGLEDEELLEDMSVGEALPRDVHVQCLSLSGTPAFDTCKDKVLVGSVLLGRVGNRYTFEYEPLERLRRNFDSLHDLAENNSFELYRFSSEAVAGGRWIGPDLSDLGQGEGSDGGSSSGSPTASRRLHMGLELHDRLLAVVSFDMAFVVAAKTGQTGRSSVASVASVSSRSSRKELQARRNWRLTWTPPPSFQVFPGDLCVCSSAEAAALRSRAAGLFSAHVSLKLGSVARSMQELSSPLLDWMVALVLPNPTSSKFGQRCITEAEAKELFKRSFKSVVAGQNRSTALRERWHRFREKFRELPECSEQRKSWMGALGGWSRGISSGSRDPVGKLFAAPGRELRLPGASSSLRPRCFLELLQATVIQELVRDCGLEVEACLSLDGERIFVLLSCTKETLLREAEQQRFHAELDLQALDPESLEPCSRDFEPLLHKFLRGLSDDTDSHNARLLHRYEQLVAAIETEWADATDEFRSRFHRARAFWLAGEMSVTSMDWDGKHSVAPAWETTDLRREAFIEYMSLRSKYGLGPHARVLMREACSRVQRHRCHSAMKLLRQWSTLVESWSCVLRNHWDRFAGGMKHGRAMAFCSKRPGMDWASFRSFEATLCNDQGSVAVPFCSKDRLRLLLSIVHRGLDLEELYNAGTLVDYMALDSDDKSDALGRAWKLPASAGLLGKVLWFFARLLEPPPTDEINHYYSSRIAFLFELTKFLAMQLFPLGLLGVALQIWRVVARSLKLRHSADMIDFAYAVALPVWVIVVLSLWRQREAWLVAHWGRTARAVHAVRPAFWGLHRRSPTAVGEFEVTFPIFYRKGILGRFPRQFISCFALLALVCVELACGIGVLLIRNHLHSHFFDMALSLPLLMQAFGFLGYEVARRLNEWENYATRSSFIGNLAFKISVFEFLNRYGILFYIAFIKAFWEGCIVGYMQSTEPCGFHEEDCEMCKEELQEYVALVLGSSVVLSSTQLILPLVWKLSVRHRCGRGRRVAMGQNGEGECATEGQMKGEGEESGKVTLSETGRAERVQTLLDRQTFGDSEVDGSFDDYLQVFVLFGYSALFSLAFPAAPLISAFALLVELRVDGVKIYNLLRRPFPIPANGLESWMRIFHSLVACAVVANAALAVWTFRLLGGEGAVARWIRFLGVLVCTSMLIAVAQLTPCLHLDVHGMPMQQRISCIVDQLVDSTGESRSTASSKNRSFFSLRGDWSCSSDSSRSGLGLGLDNEREAAAAAREVLGLDPGDVAVGVAPTGPRRAVRFAGKPGAAGQTPLRSLLQRQRPLLPVPCLGPALRCLFPQAAGAGAHHPQQGSNSRSRSRRLSPRFM